MSRGILAGVLLLVAGLGTLRAQDAQATLVQSRRTVLIIAQVPQGTIPQDLVRHLAPPLLDVQAATGWEPNPALEVLGGLTSQGRTRADRIRLEGLISRVQAAHGAPPKIADRPLSVRQVIFREAMTAQEKAITNLWRGRRRDPAALWGELRAAEGDWHGAISRRYGLSPEALRAILAEGVAKHWGREPRE